MSSPASRSALCLLGLVLGFGCRPADAPATPADASVDDPGPSVTPGDVPPPPLNTVPVAVSVILDGQPAPDALVVQGGNPEEWRTDLSGLVTIDLDLDVPGDLVVMASRPDTRIAAFLVYPEELGPVTIELKRFDPSDNPSYVFQDPGEPGASHSPTYCGHCHVTINEAWFDSPHRTAASNPVVQAVYKGSAGAPGVKSLGTTGACADCHAPGIDGQLGGRDLDDAAGIALKYGVHCDVCHHVESINMDAPAGVAGRLHLVRPSEPGTLADLGTNLPLTFGPHADIANIRMGSVQRDHFHKADLCAGCHQHEQPVLVPGQVADAARWPDGKLPIHSTFAEWEQGPMNPAAPCQSCHMPPDPVATNGADQQLFPLADLGFVAGWLRPPGSVRRHSWIGPRQPKSGMLQLAAGIFLEKSVLGGVLTVTARVKNAGPGHAIPTGEPLRSLVLLVEARCGGTPLAAVGGDAVPDFGGALARKVAGEDWTLWPGAKVGQVVRVVRRPGGFRDYSGVGPFGDGRFKPEAKGMPVEEVAGEARITAVTGGVVSFDQPLPTGDVAYLGEGEGLPSAGDAVTARAGGAGFAFARVLVGVDGRRMVPHFLAVDVASDNRLMPQTSFATTHTFASTCADPAVTAVLVHRAYPLELARERGWDVRESVMVEATR